MRAFLLAVWLGLAPLASLADTFSVRLGTTTLGSLALDGDTAREWVLVSTLENTPMGVFNGRFEGRSTALPVTAKGPARRFTGVSQSSRKSRTVSVLFAGARAVKTQIEPLAEATGLSDVAGVPAGVTDPVMAVAALTTAKGCPASITIYDGRRVIALRPDGQTADEDGLTCQVSYRVIAGPGHLSPLKIRKARMELTYATSGGVQRLQRIRLRSGPFNLTLERRN